MTALELATLATRFQSQTLPAAEWTHHAHLLVGGWHVGEFGLEEAIHRMRDGIRRLNDSHGTPNTLERGYHETITIAYLRLIDTVLADNRDHLSLHQRIIAVPRSWLGQRDALLRFYSRDILFSSRARMVWMEPDLRSFPASNKFGAMPSD